MQQNGKKPVSNLSSALASIHISPQNPNQPHIQNGNLLSNQQQQQQQHLFSGFNTNNNTNNNNNNINTQSHNTNNSTSNLNGRPTNNSQGYITTSGQNGNSSQFPMLSHQQSQDPRSQFFNNSAMDIQMSQTPDEPPLDRIALYRKNPPSEGISLFSHRVCHKLDNNNKKKIFF